MQQYRCSVLKFRQQTAQLVKTIKKSIEISFFINDQEIERAQQEQDNGDILKTYNRQLNTLKKKVKKKPVMMYMKPCNTDTEEKNISSVYSTIVKAL